MRWFKTVQSHPELVVGLKKVDTLPSKDRIDTDALDSCTKLVCLLYSSNQENDNLDELRFKLFAKKKLASDKFPPTADAFLQRMSRVNNHVFIWLYADEQILCLPSCENNGWKFYQNGNLVPVTMTKPGAPEALLTFIECKCYGSCSTRRCKCRKEDLFCTDACSCEEEICANRGHVVSESSDAEYQDDI